jgi:hypothetical protein
LPTDVARRRGEGLVVAARGVDLGTSEGLFQAADLIFSH